jgi:hypothetical protein
MESCQVQRINIYQVKIGAYRRCAGTVHLCRQMTKSFHRWLLTAALMLALPGTACSAGAGLDISDHQLTVRQFTGDLISARSVAIVSGSARNSSQAVINSPVIDVTFYGAQKDIIGTAQASRAFLEPGEIWNFSAQLTSPDAWKVRDYRITGSSK